MRQRACFGSCPRLARGKRFTFGEGVTLPSRIMLAELPEGALPKGASAHLETDSNYEADPSVVDNAIMKWRSVGSEIESLVPLDTDQRQPKRSSSAGAGRTRHAKWPTSAGASAAACTCRPAAGTCRTTAGTCCTTAGAFPRNRPRLSALHNTHPAWRRARRPSLRPGKSQPDRFQPDRSRKIRSGARSHEHNMFWII